MKQNGFRGVGAPLADVLPPAFDAELVEAFFSDDMRGPRQARERADTKVKPLDLSDYAAPSREAEAVDPTAEAVELADEGQENGSPALPEAAENALTGLERALEHA